MEKFTLKKKTDSNENIIFTSPENPEIISKLKRILDLEKKVVSKLENEPFADLIINPEPLVLMDFEKHKTAFSKSKLNDAWNSVLYDLKKASAALQKSMSKKEGFFLKISKDHEV